jgi:hypothetical protein
MRGSTQQAEGSRQQAGLPAARVAFTLSTIAVFGSMNLVGCSERVSPAAPTAVVMTSTNDVAGSPSNEAAKVNDAAVVEASAESKPSSQVAATAEPAAPEGKSEAKLEPKKESPAETKKPTRDISFDTIKFDMKKEDPFDQKLLTPTVKKLVNNKVRIRGYILPSFQQAGITQFVLVRDNLECCFGPGAALYDCVVVHMNEGKSTDFTTRPIAVEGVFSLDELRDADGKCLAIYHLQGDKVQ